jgi:hypothetical protein
MGIILGILASIWLLDKFIDHCIAPPRDPSDI